MSDNIDSRKRELRKALDDAEEKKRRSTEFSIRVHRIKTAINNLAVDLKPLFEEKGKGLEVVTPAKDNNLIEVLYYQEGTARYTRGVNTAALRIEFMPQNGVAKVLRRDSFFTPFKEVGVINISEEASEKRLTSTTFEFAKELAAK